MKSDKHNIGTDKLKIPPIADSRWQPARPIALKPRIVIDDSPAEEDEDDDAMMSALRDRRKLSSPPTPTLASPEPLLSKGRRCSVARSLSPLQRTARRFSGLVSGGAAAAVSRRLSATIGWCFAAPANPQPHIVRQGRALCLCYIKTQIKRSNCTSKHAVLKRLQRMIESECGEEVCEVWASGAWAALRALCAALERKQPAAFRQVARQATRAPLAALRSDTALTELSLALARRITRDKITWAKMAAVFCVMGALSREAVEAAEGAGVAGGEVSLEVVVAPAAALADLLHDAPGAWLAAHSGWNGIVDRLRTSETDQGSDRVLRLLISFFGLACLSLLLLRWVFHAEPAY